MSDMDRILNAFSHVEYREFEVCGEKTRISRSTIEILQDFDEQPVEQQAQGNQSQSSQSEKYPLLYSALDLVEAVKEKERLERKGMAFAEGVLSLAVTVGLVAGIVFGAMALMAASVPTLVVGLIVAVVATGPLIKSVWTTYKQFDLVLSGESKRENAQRTVQNQLSNLAIKVIKREKTFTSYLEKRIGNLEKSLESLTKPQASEKSASDKQKTKESRLDTTELELNKQRLERAQKEIQVIQQCYKNSMVTLGKSAYSE